jgi:hypothetical protein
LGAFIGIALASGSVTALLIAPDRATIDGTSQVLSHPVRVVDTRFGVGGPAVQLGAGRLRIVRLDDFPEFRHVPVEELVLRLQSIPSTASTDITVAGSNDVSITLTNLRDNEPVEVTLDIDERRELTITVAGTAIDLVGDIVAVAEINDGA